MDKSHAVRVTGTIPHRPRSVRRLHLRIAEAMRRTGMTGSRQGALKGLSRLTGNCHVRFLGGRVDW